MIAAIAVTIVLLVVAAMIARRAAKRRRRAERAMPISTTGERVADIADEPEPRVRQFLNTDTHELPKHDAGDSHLRREAMWRLEQAEVASDLASLDVFLGDVRDSLGADEAVFWRWSKQRDRLMPTCWSTSGARKPMHFDMHAWGPLVRWAAEERQITFDADARVAVVRLAAAPIELDDRLVGVLSVSRAEGLERGREHLKAWLPRHATQVGRLISLFELRRGYSNHLRQSRALLAAAKRVQAQNTQDALWKTICEAALEVSSATEAALVRWRPDEAMGWLYYQTAGFKKHELPLALNPDSLVSRVCADGLPLRLDDASKMTQPTSLFVQGDGGWAGGALAILPLTLGERVIGAIVIASERTGALSSEEGDNVTLLGALAATSLEMVWEIEEVNRRARTDALTLLPNRRAFDDSMEYLIKQADRNGRPLSLIMADIDRFKNVNDTWGHDAGDAVLKSIATTLNETKRGVDVCARFGGEEFAILLPETHAAGAKEVAERMRRAVEAKPVVTGGDEIPVTISLGVACYPEGVLTREALFAAADRALYEAKSAGRNCVRSAVPKPTGVAG